MLVLHIVVTGLSYHPVGQVAERSPHKTKSICTSSRMALLRMGLSLESFLLC